MTLPPGAQPGRINLYRDTDKPDAACMGAECTSLRLHDLPLRILDDVTEKKMYEVTKMTSAERHEARYRRRKAARENKKAAWGQEYKSFEAVFSFEHLYKSYRKCVKGVGWKASTQRYKASCLASLQKTYEQLMSGRYSSRGFFEFDIVERGKPRHIKSVHITERVVQRCLCDYCLTPLLSRGFIHDNGASLKGKGYDFAIRRLSKFLARHYRKHGVKGWALLFDFSKYFDTARHEPILDKIRRSGVDERLYKLSAHFIGNFGGIGLGLGSQISQIAALALPNALDHRIKDGLRMRHYLRYMDDGCIISCSKQMLKICLSELKRICAGLGIRLNAKKTRIVKLSRRLRFMKVRFHFGRNGGIIRRCEYKSVSRMRKKLKSFRRMMSAGKMSLYDVQCSLSSWRGHMRRFKNHKAVREVERLYKNLFEGDSYGICSLQAV